MKKHPKYIVWFSCGITSAIAAKLAVERYGKENVLVVYIHIASAHLDNWRFISEWEQWVGTNVIIIQSEKYKDQYEVIEKTGYVNGADGARCTLELKKNVRYSYQDRNPFIAQIFGFEFMEKEINRAIRFSQQYPNTKPIYPLIENTLTKNNCASMFNKAGIELPAMYNLGYNNNNCIGCVKGGMGYWNKIRVDFPNDFEKMAKAERIAGYSCLKDSKTNERIFLDELNPKRGRKLKPITPDCGTFCNIEFEDKILPEVYKILSGEMTINEVLKLKAA